MNLNDFFIVIYTSFHKDLVSTRYVLIPNIYYSTTEYVANCKAYSHTDTSYLYASLSIVPDTACRLSPPTKTRRHREALLRKPFRIQMFQTGFLPVPEKTIQK